MRKIFLLAAIAVCLALLPATAFAKGPKERSTKSKASHSDTDKTKKTKKTKGHETAAQDKTGDDRPAGWDKGKKTGWGDCDVPPGQAKPEGCKDHDDHAKGEKSKSHEVEKDKGKSKGSQTAAAAPTTTKTTTTTQKAKGTGTAATSTTTTTTKKRTTRVKDPETLKPTKVE